MAQPASSSYRSCMDQQTRDFLEHLAGMVAREFARINTRLEGMDARFDSTDEHLNTIDKRFDRVDQRFDQLDRRLGNLEATVYDLRGEMKSEFATVRSITLIHCAVTGPAGFRAHGGRAGNTRRVQQRQAPNRRS